MKKSLVLLFAVGVVVVAVSSAARLPEDGSRPSLPKVGPVWQKIVDRLHKGKSEEGKNEIPEIYQLQEVQDSEEEFRQKPMNLQALMKKMESIEEEQQNISAESLDVNDEDDADTFLSSGLVVPIKFADVRNDDDKEDDEENEDMVKENEGDIEVSYILAQPIEVADLKNDAKEEESNESIFPAKDVLVNEEEQPADEEDIQMSFGLAEPVPFAAQNSIQDDVNEDDDEEDNDIPSDVNEKAMSEIIKDTIQKFADAHGLKL